MSTSFDEEAPSPSTLTRRGSKRESLRRLFNNSFRRTRKIFGIERTIEEDVPTTTTVVQEEIIEEELAVTTFDRNATIRMSRISTKSFQIVKENVWDDNVFKSIKPVKAPASCFLLKFFPREGKNHDHKSTLNSFERKRRSHQFFGLDHHAKEQLFCPLQASQIEFAFKTLTRTDVIIKVQAPNGEVSGYIYPKRHDYTSFTPSNIGCGHGKWLVHVAVRKGCRFYHEYTKSFNLVGQGVLFFEIDNHLRLREVEKLWLDCLN